MENKEIANIHLLLDAINKIKQEIEPAEKGDATYYWTTLKFQESIYEITHLLFSYEEITHVLKQDFFINEYIPTVGMVWLVKQKK